MARYRPGAGSPQRPTQSGAGASPSGRLGQLRAAGRGARSGMEGGRGRGGRAVATRPPSSVGGTAIDGKRRVEVWR